MINNKCPLSTPGKLELVSVKGKKGFSNLKGTLTELKCLGTEEN